MSIQVYISIDTEEDLWDRYRAADNPVENIERLPQFQALCDRYGAVPTYLVNWPVVANDRSCAILSELFQQGGCEIGTHLHPWNTPPHSEDITAGNSMLCNLPPPLVKAKMARLTALVEDRLKTAPCVFRSGRWGFGPQVARALVELGYRIDSSVTPFVDWSGSSGPDFSRAPVAFYRFRPEHILRPAAEGPLLEVPPSIGFFQSNFNVCAAVRQNLVRSPLRRLGVIGLLDRLGILNFRWLSPELTGSEGLRKLARTFVRRGAEYLHMMFHSPTLLPGRSPYVGNARELSVFWGRIEAFLEYAVSQGMQFRPLSASLPLFAKGNRKTAG